MARVVRTPDGLRIELAHLAAVTALTCFAPPGGRPVLLSAGGGTIRSWDLTTGAPPDRRFAFPDDDRRPHTLVVAYLADGTRVLVAATTSAIHRWDAVAGRPLAGDLGRGSTAAVVPLPDGGTAIASSPADGVIEIVRLPEQG